jgi:hypothetical protein
MICGLWYESFEPSRPYPNEKNAKGILIDLDKHKPARSDGSWLTKLRVTCGIPSTHRFFRKGIGQLRNAVECPIGFFQLRNFGELNTLFSQLRNAFTSLRWSF